METLDWIVVIITVFGIFALGLSFAKKSSENILSYFLGSRNVPWYMLGLSMAATTFASDTPLSVTELVRKGGVSGNWLVWGFLVGGIFTAVFFAKLWRRSEVTTDIMLLPLRYEPEKAKKLSMFKAIYYGIFINAFILGWVNLAMQSIFETFLNVNPKTAFLLTAGLLAFTVIYSAVGGFLGVIYTDALQFLLAMGSCIVLAVLVVNDVGGLKELSTKVPEGAWNFFPSFSGGNFATISLGAFLTYVGLQWWSSWFPGAEPGGGGYIAQRFLAAKNEQDAKKSVILFQIINYAIRPWPWIIVALATLIIYPDLENHKLAYVNAMKDFMPVGLRGLMLAAFISAYMSTISTHLNWGTSYIINDFLKYIFPKTEKKYLPLSYISILILAVLSLWITSKMDEISVAWQILINSGAGLGTVLILRWFWWRVNVFSELTATIVPLILQVILYTAKPQIFQVDLTEFPYNFWLTLSITTICWIAITLITKPTPEEHLKKFVKKVQPAGFWKPFREVYALKEINEGLKRNFAEFLVLSVLSYSFMFFIGSVLKVNFNEIFIYGILFLLSLTIYYKKFNN